LNYSHTGRRARATFSAIKEEGYYYYSHQYITADQVGIAATE
jgi:hypothetical protein